MWYAVVRTQSSVCPFLGLPQWYHVPETVQSCSHSVDIDTVKSRTSPPPRWRPGCRFIAAPTFLSLSPTPAPYPPWKPLISSPLHNLRMLCTACDLLALAFFIQHNFLEIHTTLVVSINTLLLFIDEQYSVVWMHLCLLSIYLWKDIWVFSVLEL